MIPLEIDASLQEIKELLDSIESNEIPLELESSLNILLNQKDETESAYLDKIDNLLAIIKSLQYWIDVRNQERERLAKLIKSDSNTINLLKKYLIKHLQTKEISKLRTKRFNLQIILNSDRRLLEIKDVSFSSIPARYQRLSLEIDYFAVRKALESGEELSFACLSEPEFELKIK